MPEASRRLVVAMTGASGAIYGVRFLRQAVRHYDEIYLILSGNVPAVVAAEMGISLSSPPLPEEILGGPAPRIRMCHPHDFLTPPASGSFRHDGMVIVPCSMGTAGRIASGVSDDLITRAADVCLKERRRLVLVVRETPLNLIHLRNLTALTEAGAVVLPASPAYYHRPATIDDLVDTVVSRALQAVGATADLVPEWGIERE
jgi:4-hydroxy-3-polyprenylbenzoate decarboxylase